MARTVNAEGKHRIPNHTFTEVFYLAATFACCLVFALIMGTRIFGVSSLVALIAGTIFGITVVGSAVFLSSLGS